MRFGRVFIQRFRSLFRRTLVESEMDTEIRLHIEQLTKEYLADGMSKSEALSAAQRAFGPIDVAKEECRDMRRVNLIEDVMKDLSYAVRLLKKSPGFTLTAILSLALGIGANTAVFGLVQKIILELLPVRDPESLVRISRHIPTQPERTSLSYPVLQDLQAAAELPFDGFLGFSYTGRMTMVTESGAEPVAVELVSGSYFEILGVRPAVGRLFTPDDDRTPGAHPVAVISHNYWIRRFGGDALVLNKMIRLNRYPFTIIGVSPRGFDGLQPGSSPDIRVPIHMDKQLGYAPGPESMVTRRGSRWLAIFGRLKPGITHAQASSALLPILHHDHELFGGQPRDEQARRARALERLQVSPGSQGNAGTRAQFERALWVLAAVVAAVLLLACVNIAHLLLARGAAREREFSLRTAIGASRMRLVRQLLTESLLLACLGGVFGLALAHALSQFVVSMIVSDQIHSTLAVGPNPLLVAFNFVVTLSAGVLFGLIPAVLASHTTLTPGLKGAHSANRGHVTGRNLLVSFQVAASVVLLIGAGLFVRTLQAFHQVDVGFRPAKLIQFRLDPAGYSPEQVLVFFGRVRERIEALPGAQAATVSRQPLVADARWNSGITVEGYTPPAGEPVVYRDAVSPGYFGTLGIPLVAGREFGDSDHAPAQKVAIINESFAKHYFAGQSPLGKRIGPAGGIAEHTVVGVVKDAKYASLREEPAPFWYVPYWQLDPHQFHAFTICVRTSGDPKTMINAIRQEVADIDKAVALFDVKTVEAQISENLRREHLLATLTLFFGGLAALLVAIGLFGVLSYSISQREREIGIRMALGARPIQAAWTMVREITFFTGLGLGIGVAVALWLSHFVERLLFGIKANDPISIVAACCLMVVIAAVAAFIPARRAAAIEPAVACRAD